MPFESSRSVPVCWLPPLGCYFVFVGVLERPVSPESCLPCRLETALPRCGIQAWAGNLVISSSHPPIKRQFLKLSLPHRSRDLRLQVDRFGGQASHMNGGVQRTGFHHAQRQDHSSILRCSSIIFCLSLALQFSQPGQHRFICLFLDCPQATGAALACSESPGHLLVYITPLLPALSPITRHWLWKEACLLVMNSPCWVCQTLALRECYLKPHLTRHSGLP